MRTSGLPCRATPDCEVVFTLERQDSLDALRAAARARDAHETGTHGYRHQVRETSVTPFSQGPAARRRGKRSGELSPV